jgi:hypothetical protein
MDTRKYHPEHYTQVITTIGTVEDKNKLALMARQDQKSMADFLRWLIRREAKARGVE